jgi:ADP-heptose:LPS heptosyltransferase
VTSLSDSPPRLSLADRLSVRKIAVVRALHLGDLLLAVPAFRAIRRGFPAAEITLIGLAWSAEFVRRFSAYVDRWREFPGYPGILEAGVDEERTARFLAEERAYRYDLVLQLHGNGQISNHFALAIQGKRTVGFFDGAPPDGMWLGVPYPDGLNEIERNLTLTRLLGLPGDDVRLGFPVLPEDESALRSALSHETLLQRPVVGLHPGARPPARRWPAEHFAVVGDALARRFGATIVITGGPSEGSLAEAVAVKMTSHVVNLAERTSVGGLAALIRKLDLFISNDTGPSQVAVALDRPSISIFGPADRVRWGPLDQTRHRIAYREVECSPCPHWECPIDHRCLRWLEPVRVLTIAEELLASGRREGEAQPCIS